MNAEPKFPTPADVPWMDEQEAKDRAKAARKAARDRAFDKWYGEGMAKAAPAEVKAARKAGTYAQTWNNHQFKAHGRAPEPKAGAKRTTADIILAIMEDGKERDSRQIVAAVREERGTACHSHVTSTLTDMAKFGQLERDPMKRQVGFLWRLAE